MNISAANYDELVNEFSTESSLGRTRSAPTAKRGTPTRGFSRRSRKGPQQFNGIHRRRRKQIKW